VHYYTISINGDHGKMLQKKLPMSEITKATLIYINLVNLS